MYYVSFKPVQRVLFCQTIKSSKISFIIICHNNTKTFLYNNTYIPRYIHVHVIRYQYSNLFFESSDHLNNFFETHYLDLPQVKCGRATTTVFHWNFIHVMQNTPFIKYKNKPHFASRLCSIGLPLSRICVVVTIWSIGEGLGRFVPSTISEPKQIWRNVNVASAIRLVFVPIHRGTTSMWKIWIGSYDVIFWFIFARWIKKISTFCLWRYWLHSSITNIVFLDKISHK